MNAMKLTALAGALALALGTSAMAQTGGAAGPTTTHSDDPPPMSTTSSWSGSVPRRVSAGPAQDLPGVRAAPSGGPDDPEF